MGNHINMETDIAQKLAAIERKVDAISASVNKTRKYLMWKLIITIALIVLPLIGLVFAVPAYLSTLQGLGI